MKVIVGLGNPGSNYSLTKHNFGFWVIDKLVKQSSLKYKAGKGEYVFAQSNEYMFVKPTTYMNNSGIAIKQFLNYYKLDISSLIIIYDDIDIDLGRIKFRAKGTDGGHNGIKSINNANYFYIYLSIFILLITIQLRAIRWHFLFKGNVNDEMVSIVSFCCN